jgi:hypothetical protein
MRGKISNNKDRKEQMNFDNLSRSTIKIVNLCLPKLQNFRIFISETRTGRSEYYLPLEGRKSIDFEPL